VTQRKWDPRPGQPVDELDTPAVLIDLDRVESNIAQLQQTVGRFGVGLRPHIKTHKVPAIAGWQRAAGAVGITSAKLSEAEVFVDAGHDDVVIAYPIFGATKWARAAELAKRCRLTVHVENQLAAEGLDHAAAAAGVQIGIRLEIDTGFHRCGVAPSAGLDAARELSRLPNLRFDGITTHRSAFFPDAGGRPIEALGREEGELMVEIAETIRTGGIDVPVVVGGSTPTTPSFAGVPGVTEACSGTYVFYDEGMSELGVCSRDQIAFSIMCTVVSVRGRNVVLDGGSKTFSKDSYSGKPGLFGKAVVGTGHLAWLTEEHGGLALGPDDPVPALGSKLACQPMHVCPVVNLTDTLIGVRGGVVEEVFPVAARGRIR
jgi:D-serine deaminase-like pyridoxal phosphate-dependent protein